MTLHHSDLCRTLFVLLPALVSASAGCRATPKFVDSLKQHVTRSSTADAATAASNESRRVAASDSGNKKRSNKDLGRRDYAEIQLALAKSLMGEGQLEAAERALMACRRNDPDNAEAVHRLALVKEKQGKGNEAHQLFLEALAMRPDDPVLHSDFGYCCYLREDWSLAEQHLRRAIQLDPDLQRAHNNLGLTLIHLDQQRQAMNHFAAAGLSPAAARNNVGFVLAKSRRIPEAQEQLRLALRREPKLQQAQRVANVLKRMSADHLSDQRESHESDNVASGPKSESSRTTATVTLADPQFPEPPASPVQPANHTSQMARADQARRPPIATNGDSGQDDRLKDEMEHTIPFPTYDLVMESPTKAGLDSSETSTSP